MKRGSRMKKLALTAVCGVMGSGRYDWVNFSGVYRGVGGGPLVTNYTDQREQPGDIVGETLARGNGLQTVFSGGLRNGAVTDGSVTVTAGGAVLRDEDGVLAGTGGTGTVTYRNGFVTITFDVAPAVDVPIQVSYSFERPTDLPSLGSTGRIYSFSVEHTGNRLVMTDNTGAVYEGNLGRVSNTGGETGGQDTPLTGTVLAQFTAKGVSGAGKQVTMTGTLQGVAGGGQIGSRSILGTWIEKDGKTGNIQGEAAGNATIPIDEEPETIEIE